MSARAGALFLAVLLAAACQPVPGNGGTAPEAPPETAARLTARPGPPAASGAAVPKGPRLRRLRLGGGRDGLLCVPESYRPDRPAPLVLMLHGATGDARGGLEPFRELAEAAGLLLLAPESRMETWDAIHGRFGPDVAFVDRALAQTFAGYSVDPGHVAIEGFSDGATYALSLGLANGDLFTDVIAFSPGTIAPALRRGRPRVFVSHGTWDRILPIDGTSRRIVPFLRGEGYDVLYREFDGVHTVPPAVARQALDRFLGR